MRSLRQRRPSGYKEGVHKSATTGRGEGAKEREWESAIKQKTSNPLATKADLMAMYYDCDT